MKVIQPNCRIQFTAADIDFISRILQGDRDDQQWLIELLNDSHSRDLLLDNEKLYQAILEDHACLGISDHFYFYILVRQGLLRTGIADRNVADYVAEVLTQYSRTDRSRFTLPGEEQSLDYFFEMMAALRTADERTRFYIRTHIGNQSLFLSGVFPDRIRYRAESRGFPDLRYYQALGESNFRVASDHPLAQRYDLGQIFSILGDRFEEARTALNDLADRTFNFDSFTAYDHLLNPHRN